MCVCGGGGTEGGGGRMLVRHVQYSCSGIVNNLFLSPLCVCVCGGRDGGGGGGGGQMLVRHVQYSCSGIVNNLPPTPTPPLFFFFLSFCLVVQGFVAVVFLFV